ncbi:MAG TPA: hypothetical protein VKU84_14380, partial [Stellaceae bacterium]|nr:hypothetical protein [Stellaceae bacterium]
MAGKHTLIRNADWVIAWDQSQSRHVYRKGIDIQIKDDRIAHLSPAGPEPPPSQDTNVIDGRGCMIMPGLIDLHAHPSTEPGYRGVREDHGCLEHYMASLFERAQAFRLSEVGRRAALEVAY